MIVCDRCKTPDPKNYNFYIGDRNCDICDQCKRDYEELSKVFDAMEKTFLKGKNLKHIDLQWEDK